MSNKDLFSEMLKLKGKVKDPDAQKKFSEWYSSLDDSDKQAFDKYDKKWTRITIIIVAVIFIALLGSCFGGGRKNKEETKPQVTQTQQTEGDEHVDKKAKTQEEAKKKAEEMKGDHSHMLLSKQQIEQRTGAYVTDFHLLDYGEVKLPNGDVDTHGVIEFNSEPQEYKFWAKFRDGKMVRLKIGPQIIFDETK